MNTTCKKNILLGIIITITFFIVIEIIGNFVYFFTYKDFFWNRGDERRWLQFTLNYAYEYIPNSYIKFVGFSTNNTLGVDINGFVHNGYNRKINENDYLIFILGGSSIEGRGSTSNSNTIAAYLERILNENNPMQNKKHIRVVNAGCLGYTSYQQFNMLNGKILPNYNPKIIIELDGINDALNGISYADHGWKPNWYHYSDRITNDIRRIMHQGPIKPIAFLLVNSLKTYSTIACALDRLIHGEFVSTKNYLFPQREKPSTKAIERMVETYLNNHILSHKVSRLNRIKYYAFLQPVLLKNKKNFTEKDYQLAKKWSIHFKGNFFDSSLEEFYTMVEDRIEKIPYFYDISSLFMDTKEQVYHDHVHYTDLGNLIIAKKIASIIQADSLKDKEDIIERRFDECN